MHWAFAIALGCLTPLGPLQTDDAQRQFFEAQVRPVLAENCASCHGPKRVRGGLRLDHGKGVEKGGDGGKVIVPGDPEASRLVGAVRYDEVDLRMPPRGRLGDADVATLVEWVRRGAWWPPEGYEAKEADQVAVFDLEQRKSEHWAWTPIQDPAIPSVGQDDWARDPVDRFLLARVEAAGLVPAADTSDRGWLRRVSFDVIGFPPTPAEIADYLADASPDRDAKVVDRLLASEHFGERWGRHWLDLVRYAESYGHEFDYTIPEPWRYRDYVIRGLNADVPFDQWLKEQLAGDLLPEPRRHPQDGTDESILGTGFFHFHQSTHAPVDVRQDEAERFDNQIDVMTKTFLGMTVACARCHDHKFDAISTKDFYALAGYLQSSRREFSFLDAGGRIAAGVDELTGLRAQAQKHWAPAQEQLQADVSRFDRYLLGAQGFRGAAPMAQGVEHEGEILPERQKTGGKREKQEMGAFAGTWGGNAQLFWREAKPGNKLGLGVEVPSSGRYSITLHLTNAHDYGRFRVKLDGKVLLEELDLYNPEVIPSVISLGEHDLDVGERRLEFEVTGSHPDAAPVYMFGLDKVVLAAADPEAEGKWAQAREEIAARHEIDPEQLERWAVALGDPECRKPEHPLYAWTQLAPLTEPDAFTAKLEQLQKQAEPRSGHENEVVFEDFEDGYEGWSVRGQAFGDGPADSSTWDARRAQQPGREFSMLSTGAADSGQLSTRLQGSIRSRTFTIEKSHIHYKVKGNGGKIRVIIDGYFMDVFNGLLFSGVSFDVRNRDQFGWHDQYGDLSKFIGHRAHIEILDHGDGWIAVDEIRFSDEGPRQRDARGFTLSALTEAHARQGGDPPLLDALVAGYGHAASRLADAVFAGEQDPQSSQFLEWCSTHGLLPASEPTRSALSALAQDMLQRGNALPHPLKSLTMGDGSGEDEYVFIRGSHKLRGDTVPRRNLEALGGEGQPRPESGSGRLALAEHFLDDSNPLVARVQVNRIWHHLFGRGLVPTTDNFGVLGNRPTHPQLLDHLATWFRGEAGWSRKALIRRLVLTRAYRMSSSLRDRAIEEKDPDNQLLHRMRAKRLEGEVLRDALLSISGRLDRKLYGPSIPVHLTAFMQGRGRPGSGPQDGNGRRSIYLALRRNFISPLLLAFDAPLPHTTVGRRTVSNVPAQALILMNDPFVHDQAKRWSERLRQESPDDADAQLALAYELAFGRPPTEPEARRAAAFLVAAAEPGGVGAERGLADLCHVLFNVKEFVFVP